MMAKMKSLKRTGESRFSISVVVSECVGEACKTGEDNQGAVVGREQRTGLGSCIYICDGEE